MSNTEELKKYLINEDDGYLLNDGNNGKTIMLSGKWGAGKTHFWREEIEPSLSANLKDNNKACVYVSLYGEDDLQDLKNKVLFSAYESVKGENQDKQKVLSVFGIGARALAGIRAFGFNFDFTNIVDESKEHIESEILEESKELLDGGLICFDDFERKSKQIDLNDLFGFITQLTIEMNCKVVIILNSDVFEGEETNIFKTVKEKTVNKFFYYEPSIEELFKLIYASNKKYNKLDDYKEEILQAIEEIGELNARIYIQVLDNCLEWITKKYEVNYIRVIVIATSSFVSSSLILNYEKKTQKRIPMVSGTSTVIEYIELERFHKVVRDKFTHWLTELPCVTKSYDAIIEDIQNRLRGKTKEGTFIFSDNEQSTVNKQLKDNEILLKTIWKYGYQLYYFSDVEEEAYFDIKNFIEKGILLSKENS